MRHLLSIAALLLATSCGFAAEDLIWRFDTDGDLEGWTPANFESVEVADGVLRGVTQYDCQLLSPELNIAADEYTVAEFRVASTVTGSGEVFFARPDESFSDARKATHQVYAGEQPRVYRSQVGAQPDWTGTIQRIRLDILNPAGAQIALDYIRITNAPRGIVPNWSFEDDFDGDGVPDAWTIEAADSAWTAENAVQGDRALMIAARGPDRTAATASTDLLIDRTGLYEFDATIARRQGRMRTVGAQIAFRDVFERPLSDSTVTISRRRTDDAGAEHLSAQFEVPRLAAAATLTLQVEGGDARVWWDAIDLRHIADLPAPCERPLESWRGEWIWAGATLGQDDAPAYLRKRFELPVPPERLTSAMAQLTADDQYELWVNGVMLSESLDPDGWRTPETVDLRPHLMRGANVIAVAARDVQSAEGLLFEASILWGRKAFEIVSDDSWRAVGEALEGWNGPGFDDSAWPAAAVIAAGGSPPWGDVPYTYFGPREEIALSKPSVPPQINAGEPLRVSAILDHLPAAAADQPLRLSLLRDGAEVLCWTRPVTQVTRTTDDGVEIGPIAVRTSRFLVPGAYDVALGFPHTNYTDHEGIVIGTVQVRAPAELETRPRVAVRQYHGVPTLMLDDKPNPFMYYVELHVGTERITNMANAGVHLYFFNAEDIGWKGDGSFDYADWDARIMRLLSLDPDALVIPQFTVDGRYQQWWLPEHPEELTRTESGGSQVGVYHVEGEIISLASQLWREQAGDAVRRFVQHCWAAGYGSRIIGLLVASGVSWEWQHWGSVGEHEPTDYSAPMQAEFRKWVRREYAEDEEALRAAWRMPEVSFDTVIIPSVAERDGADHLLFRDPRTSRYVIDFYRFFQDVMADGILHYFGIVKEATRGEALAGTYYGYVVTMLGGARRAGDSGHMALSRVIESDACDFLLSPFDYSQRSVGEPTTIMSATGSVLAHGKLWGMETDLRTHLVTDPRQRGYGAPDHLDGTVSQLRRAFATCATKGLAVRWYDFSNGWIADDPRQGQVIGQLRDLADRWVEWDRSPDTEGIAVVVDEDTPAAYLSHGIEAMQWLVYRQKATFERVGAPWRVYLLDDIVSGLVPKHRAYVFLNCFHMTDEERAFIREELQSDGRTLLWMYAPGYVAEDLDVARISELTAMDFREIEEMRRWSVELDPNHPWAEGLEPGAYPQPNIEIGPVFVPAADGAEVVGTWQGSELPGLAVKRLDNWTSVYSAGPILSPLLLKRIMADAGVRIPVAGTEPSYVDRNLIGLHTAVTRTERLHFGTPTRVIDLVTGEILSAACTDLEVEVEGPGTRLLRTRPAY